MPKFDPDVLVDKIAEYAGTINETLQEVAEALRAGHYGTACTLMQNLSQEQAATSLSMRNILTKAGLIGGPDDED